MHRLRFAPSPTGYLHVGGARTALFNWLFVKKYGGQFLLRVEDTDKARSTDESTRAIFEGLEWLGLNWDEEVVYPGREPRAPSGRRARAARRGQRVSLLLHAARSSTSSARPPRRAARRSGTTAGARVCRRTRSRGASRAGMPFVIRFRMPEGETSWTTRARHDHLSEQGHGEGDFIILRSDGTPIYNLAVVSDDIAMRITLVMRGDDHISNTPKQILLYQALGAPLPQFAHLPMIHGMDGKKLSKRHGATAVGDYQHMGILSRGDAQLSRAARLVAGQRHRGDDRAADDRAVLDRRAVEEGGDLRHEEARVDERPAPRA